MNDSWAQWIIVWEISSCKVPGEQSTKSYYVNSADIKVIAEEVSDIVWQKLNYFFLSVKSTFI